MSKDVYITKERQALLDLIDQKGPVSAAGASRLLETDRRAISACLRAGAKVGVFEELEAAPGVYQRGPNAT